MPRHLSFAICTCIVVFHATSPLRPITTLDLLPLRPTTRHIIHFRLFYNSYTHHPRTHAHHPSFIPPSGAKSHQDAMKTRQRAVMVTTPRGLGMYSFFLSSFWILFPLRRIIYHFYFPLRLPPYPRNLPNNGSYLFSSTHPPPTIPIAILVFSFGLLCINLWDCPYENVEVNAVAMAGCDQHLLACSTQRGSQSPPNAPRLLGHAGGYIVRAIPIQTRQYGSISRHIAFILTLCSRCALKNTVASWISRENVLPPRSASSRCCSNIVRMLKAGILLRVCRGATA